MVNDTPNKYNIMSSVVINVAGHCNNRKVRYQRLDCDTSNRQLNMLFQWQSATKPPLQLQSQQNRCCRCHQQQKLLQLQQTRAKTLKQSGPTLHDATSVESNNKGHCYSCNMESNAPLLRKLVRLRSSQSFLELVISAGAKTVAIRVS